MGNSSSVRRRRSSLSSAPSPSTVDLQFIPPDHFVSSFQNIFAVIRSVYHRDGVGTLLARRKSDRSRVALKVFPREQENNKIIFAKEVTMLQTLAHPNIILFCGAYVDSSNFVLVTEFCDNGNLTNFIPTVLEHGEKFAAKIVGQILEAVKHMHRRNIVHRDLKPDNILVQNANVKSPRVVLIDFGAARFVSEDDEDYSDWIGTEVYMAPECGRTRSCLKAVDIWAVGIIAYQLVTGKRPFRGKDRVELFGEIRRKQVTFPSYVSSSAKRFIKNGLLNRTPELRCTAASALENTWLRHWERSDHDEYGLNIISHEADYFECSPLKQLMISVSLCDMERDLSEMISIVFDEMDLDFDGFISVDDVEVYLEKQGQEDCKNMADRFIHKNCYDDDGGFLDPIIRALFEMVDMDNDGFISTTDLLQLVRKYSQKFYSVNFLSKIIGQVRPMDISRGLTFEEFRQAMYATDGGETKDGFYAFDRADDVQMFSLFGDLESAIAIQEDTGPHGLSCNVIMVDPLLIGAPLSPLTPPQLSNQPSASVRSTSSRSSKSSRPSLNLLRPLSLQRNDSVSYNQDSVVRVI